jgi:hypothetical protein
MNILYEENKTKDRFSQVETTQRLHLLSEITKSSEINSVALVRKRTIPTERPPLSAK